MLQPAQMDFGRELSGLCPLIGTVLLVATFVGWWWTLSARPRKPFRLFFAVCLSVLAVLWAAAAIDDHFFEPHIDEMEARSIVEQLPEWRQPPPVSVQAVDLDHEPPDCPLHTLEFHVCESGTVWHRVRVNLIDSRVTILNDSNRWVPVRQWGNRPN